MNIDFIYDKQIVIDALEEFDAGAKARMEMWDNAESIFDVNACCRADRAAVKKVQEAFYELTKDRNRLEDCYKVEVDRIREIVGN